MRSFNLFKQNTDRCEASPSFPINFPARTLTELWLRRTQNKWSSRSCSNLHMFRNINGKEVHVGVVIPTSAKGEKEEKPEEMVREECCLRTNLPCSCYKCLTGRCGYTEQDEELGNGHLVRGWWQQKVVNEEWSERNVKWKCKWRVKT